jgi:AraC family transcriptional regulator
MLSRRVLVDGEVQVAEIRCDAGPADPTVAEEHRAWAVSLVQRGSFRCRCGNVDRDMVPGSVLIGRPGAGFECSHQHHANGDTCLAVFLAPALVDELTHGQGWNATTLAPTAELMVRGAVMQAAAAGATDIGLDEAALSFVSGFVQARGQGERRAGPRRVAQNRRRIVQSALWIEAHLDQPLSLARMAAVAAMTTSHYLRQFAAVVGVTPHQYLVRCRLRHAARLLASEPERPVTDVALASGFEDLSNFVRTFRRASGLAPGRFRAQAPLS